MAYDEFLADRVRFLLNENGSEFEEKRMMGGLCFMVDGKMCIGVDIDKATSQSRLMARIGEKQYQQALTQKDELDIDHDLDYWVKLSLAFNPFAKSSKKKNKTE